MVEKEKFIFAFIFDSGRFDVYDYGDVVFRQILKGREIVKNSSKVVVSLGDILDDTRFIDIEPYIVNDEYCTIDLNNVPQFKDYPFCWIVEDLDSEIAQQLDNRLRSELNGYIGLTRIDVSSRDYRKQFWKRMCRDFNIDKQVITCFQDPNISDLFCYAEAAAELGFDVEYDSKAEYSDVEECGSLRSSFVKSVADLEIQDGKNDADRNIMSLNSMLCRELSIAGALIWRSINDVDKVHFDRNFLGKFDHGYFAEYAFFALYHASQGIERLQKIIVELIYKRDHLKGSDRETAYKLLMGHNHEALNDWIYRMCEKSAKQDHKKFLQLLRKFYNELRYFRFSDDRYIKTTTPEFELLLDFGERHEQENTDEEVKARFGNALGQIAKNYYDLIYDICTQLNIYSYEFASDSAARFVFYSNGQVNNLYKKLKQIRQGKKELLYWLIKSGKQFPKYPYADVEPLAFEVARIDEYLEELINNPEDGSKLYDEFDYLYDELYNENRDEWKQREILIDAIIANPDVVFSDSDYDEDD